MARYSSITVLRSFFLIAMLGRSTCSTNGIALSNEDQTQRLLENYEVLLAKVNQLESIVSSRGSNIISPDPVLRDTDDNRQIPFYDPYYQHHRPQLDMGKLRKMPTSCSDLRYKGEFKNGFYTVKKDQSLKVIFCDFWKEETSASYEKLIGYTDVKTSPVYFFVTKSQGFPAGSGKTLTFDLEYTNTGGSLNLATGIFTAPKPGTYFFSFSGIAKATAANGRIWTQLRRNTMEVKDRLAWGFCDQSVSGQFCTFTMRATLNLKAGDTIFLTVDNDKSFLHDDDAHYTHYTGWLIEEDISSVLTVEL